MRNRTKLELTWIGKGNQPKLEPRILLEDQDKSYHTERRVTDSDIFDNILIHGDNLLALKALEQDYTGKVKCIYIDPPYNTGNAFEHYDDGLEHSIWLNLMKQRLEILHNLLSEDGSIWISIDENEGHYLKVMCDEVFNRQNFIIQTTIKRGAATGHKAINPTPVQVCDHMLSYAKNKSQWIYKPVYLEREYDKAYSKFIDNFNDNYQDWDFITLKEALEKYSLTLKSALNKFPERIVRFAQPSYSGVGKETRDLIDISKKDSSKIYLLERDKYSNIYLWKGDRILFYKDKMKEIDGKLVTAELVTNIWTDMNYQGIAKEGNVTFKKGKKPEAQVRRVFQMSTNSGDLVLDSFLGSGTTAAVAHKMGRRWIGIELGDHCKTHCLPRLTRVVNGEDQTGISKAVNWKGGGGFRYYHLAPSLLEKDKWGNWVISKDYNGAMLAEAMCKHEGFTYAPSEEVYWQHGHSTETDFIYVTTQMLNHQQLIALSDEIGTKRSLLVCCSAFRAKPEAFPNLTMKKIPKAVLKNCEWGHDDYSSEVSALPTVPTPEEQAEQLIKELPLFAREEKE